MIIFRRSQSKSKSIGHATACGTLVTLRNSNIRDSLTCPKTWGKGRRWLKILKNGNSL